MQRFVDSCPLTMELVYLQLYLGAFLLTIGAFALTVGAFLLTFEVFLLSVGIQSARFYTLFSARCNFLKICGCTGQRCLKTNVGSEKIASLIRPAVT